MLLNGNQSREFWVARRFNSKLFNISTKKGKKATMPPYLFPNKVTLGKDYFPSK